MFFFFCQAIPGPGWTVVPPTIRNFIQSVPPMLIPSFAPEVLLTDTRVIGITLGTLGLAHLWWVHVSSVDIFLSIIFRILWTNLAVYGVPRIHRAFFPFFLVPNESVFPVYIKILYYSEYVQGASEKTSPYNSCRADRVKSTGPCRADGLRKTLRIVRRPQEKWFSQDSHFSWGRRTILCVFLNRSALQGPVDFNRSALQELQGVSEKF